MNGALVRLLRALAASSQLPDVQDNTVYGTNRRSTHSFFAHHLAAMSMAIVRGADATTLLNAASVLNYDLTSRPPVSRGRVFNCM